MGRAGSGGGGGGHSSGGGHSFSSHSSGGHHVSGGGGRRAGSGGGGSYHGSNYHSSGHYHNGRYGGGFNYYGGPVFYHSNGIVSTAIAVIILVMIFAFNSMLSGGGSGSIPRNTQNREKLESGVGFNNNCITDEIGWFDNISKTETKLKSFYNKTGVQPYVVLRKYDASLTSDDAKTKFAEKWYDENIGAENGFLFMYFAEQDVDNDVGYMAYVNGKQVSTVMDSEAVEIFWAYIDKYWHSDMSTDDMFITVFDKTAARIMDKTTTAADIGNNVIKIIGIIVFISGIIIIMKIRRKHKAAENAETERILNSPLDEDEDELLKKYKKNGGKR